MPHFCNLTFAKYIFIGGYGDFDGDGDCDVYGDDYNNNNGNKDK